MKLFTHLNFGGNCEAAFRFYEQHLGGSITTMMRKSDLPAGSPAPPGPADAVIHARLSLGDFELIGNDVPSEIFQPVRSSYLYLAVDSPADADRVYAAFAEGGQIGIPMQETFFAHRFVQLRDKFGTLWTVICERQT